MTRVGEVVSEDPELLVAHQHEEQNEANECTHEQQKSKEQALRGTNAIDASGCLSEGNSATRQHHLQAMFEVFIVGVLRVAANVFPHDVDDDGANQRVLDDERIQVGSRISDDCAHDIDSLAARGVQVEWCNG